MKTTTKLTAKRLTCLAVLTAASLIAFTIESLLPPLFVPGAKLGLSNVFTLICLFVLGLPSALLLTVARTVLGSLIVGNLYSLLYSLGGGLIALAVTAILWYCAFGKLSVLSISVLGAVTHNIAQNIIFVLVSNTTAMLSYMPYLALIGALSGVVVGATVFALVKALPNSLLERVCNESA